MKRATDSRFASLLCGLLLSLAVPRRTLAEPTPQALAAYDTYLASVESRLALQPLSHTHTSAITLQQLTPANLTLPGALLHHWRASTFVPNASAPAFERLLKDFNAYPKNFAPQVLQTSVLTQQPDHLLASMRVRQRHVLTVVMDATCDVTFAHPNPHTGASTSRCLHLYEIANPGTARERALTSSEEHGFLWRLNTYWTWEERDNGLYLQVETVSLSRSIPAGLAWALAPYVTSVPRESLEFTLTSARNALQQATPQEKK